MDPSKKMPMRNYYQTLSYLTRNILNMETEQRRNTTGSFPCFFLFLVLFLFFINSFI